MNNNNNNNNNNLSCKLKSNKKLKQHILNEIIEYLSFSEYKTIMHVSKDLRKVIENFYINKISELIHLINQILEKLEIKKVNKNKDIYSYKKKYYLFLTNYFQSCFLLDNFLYNILKYNILIKINKNYKVLLISDSNYNNIVNKFINMINITIDKKFKDITTLDNNQLFSKINTSNTDSLNLKNMFNEFTKQKSKILLYFKNYIMSYIIENNIDINYYLDLNNSIITYDNAEFIRDLISNSYINNLNLSNCLLVNKSSSTKDTMLVILEELCNYDKFFTLDITNITYETNESSKKITNRIKEIKYFVPKIKIIDNSKTIKTKNNYSILDNVKESKKHKINDLTNSLNISFKDNLTINNASTMLKINSKIKYNSLKLNNNNTKDNYNISNSDINANSKQMSIDINKEKLLMKFNKYIY